MADEKGKMGPSKLTISNTCPESDFWIHLAADHPSGQNVNEFPRKINAKETIIIDLPQHEIYQNLILSIRTTGVPIPLEDILHKNATCAVLIKCPEKSKKIFKVETIHNCPAPDPLKLPVT